MAFYKPFSEVGTQHQQSTFVHLTALSRKLLMFSTISPRISLSQLSLSSLLTQITSLDSILAYLPLLLFQAILLLSFYPCSVFQDTILERLLRLWFNKPRLPREAVKHLTYWGPTLCTLILKSHHKNIASLLSNLHPCTHVSLPL